MAMSVPAGPIRSARRRACPPAPNVQSTTTSPGDGAVRSISSPARTGMWEPVMSRRIAKLLRHLLDLRVEALLLGGPALPVPDLEVVPHARHNDLLLHARVAEQRWRQRYATGRVELDVERVGLMEARERPRAGAHRVQPAQGPLNDRLVRPRRPD